MSEIEPILVVEDDHLANASLVRNLKGWGYQVVSALNGQEAWEMFIERPVSLVLTDWMMPQMDGVTLCKKLRELKLDRYIYIIFLTGKMTKPDTVEALEAGADDYLTKPFHPEELQARMRAAFRVIRLEKELREKNRSLNETIQELEHSLKTIKQLKGLLPICMYCRKIRNDKDYWEQLESYVHEQAAVDFSHSICPDCYVEHFSVEK